MLTERITLIQSPASTVIPDRLEMVIQDTSSSVESLKMDFLATANAMFGPGFVWLVKNLDREGTLNILCTYNAGTPYPNAYARRQSVDMSTFGPFGPRTDLGNRHAGSMGVHAANQTKLALGAAKILPLLGVNTWEHVWMMDYGISGKAEYLERWWAKINWDAVWNNYNSWSTGVRPGFRR